MAKTLSKRYSGVLAHPTSFPSPYGIGDFGKGAYDFINFLTGAGQSLWQILPLGHTGYGDSPYQAFSAFAGQPLLISPDELIKDGLLYGDDLRDYPHFNPDHIYYGDVIPAKLRILHRSYEIFKESADLCMLKEFDVFCEHEKDWLDDYALFMAGKDAHGGACWLEWEDDLRDPDEEIKAAWCERLADSIEYYKYIQFIFFRQWNAIRDYAHVNGIKIVGDIPIFVALDSADVWANRELFQLEKDGYPTVVAGVPPDYFSATGQLWGNPHYAWREHEKTGFAWWLSRIQKNLQDVDILRIDHFRGFSACWEVAFGAEDTRGGKWTSAPGEAFFTLLKEKLGSPLPLIAEDLGIITDEVAALRDFAGLPGMRILQFAFGQEKNNPYLPHCYDKNTVVYTGTHDNDTTNGWYQAATEQEKDHYRRYLNVDGSNAAWDFIRLALSSPADTAILPLQDVLSLGTEHRMNIPGTTKGNWGFTFSFDWWQEGFSEGLRYLSALFGRNEQTEKAAEETDEFLR